MPFRPRMLEKTFVQDRAMVRFCWIGMLFCLMLAPLAMAAGKAETVRNMTISETTPSLQIEVRYPVLGIKAVDDDIQDWAKQLVTSFKDDFTEESRAVEGTPTPYSLNVNYTVLRPSPAAVSVVWEIGSYTGGAHGSLYLSTANYTVPQGQVIEFAEVFGKPEVALETLSTICYRQLGEQLGDLRVDDMLREGTAPRLENFANIALLPTGVRIYFSPYEVAPWAAGLQQVDIPLEQLRTAEPRLSLWGR